MENLVMITNWPTKKLGEIAKIYQGGKSGLTKKDYVKSGFSVFSATGPDGFTKKSFDSGNAVILSAIGARCGKCFYAEGKWTAIANTQVIKFDNPITARFMYYYLNNESRWPRFGSAQPFIAPSTVKRLKVPFPPLKIQKQIVERLDKIAEAQKLNNELVQKADELFQSLLHQELNSEGENWKVVSLGKIAEIKGGKRIPKGMNITSVKTSHPYLRVVDFMDNSVKIKDLKYIDDEVFKFIKNYTISSKDVYISIAGTIGLIGKIPSSLDGANLTENAAKILIDEKIINQDFLIFILSTINSRKQIKKFTQAVGVPKLALERIKKIQISLPSLKVQKQIVEKLSVVQEYKKQLLAQKSKLKELFDSVLNKSMKGESIKLC